jgi:multiple sugar transport system substrate-binding protein
MKDVYAECEKKHGKAIDLAIKSTYNPKTKRYFAFSDSFVPDPIDYRNRPVGRCRHEAGLLGRNPHRR